MTSLLEAPSSATEPRPELLRGASLFLDFDGTLVDIAPRPDAVIVDGRLRALLLRLARVLDGRLAIVSGRAVAEIAGFFPDHPLSISGSHGIELSRAGATAAAPAPPGWIAAAATDAEKLCRAHPGVLVERKPFGIAIHYREAPAAEQAVHAFATSISGPDRTLQPGKMVVEVRQAGGDKGSALRTLMADPAMAGTRPIFIGDDLTDETAFRAAAALGGAGILVGPPRPSAAAYRLDSVERTLAWLDAATKEYG